MTSTILMTSRTMIKMIAVGMRMAATSPPPAATCHPPCRSHLPRPPRTRQRLGRMLGTSSGQTYWIQPPRAHRRRACHACWAKRRRSGARRRTRGRFSDCSAYQPPAALLRHRQRLPRLVPGRPPTPRRGLSERTPWATRTPRACRRQRSWTSLGSPAPPRRRTSRPPPPSTRRRRQRQRRRRPPRRRTGSQRLPPWPPFSFQLPTATRLLAGARRVRHPRRWHRRSWPHRRRCRFRWPR
mmetsp:Transcript_36445/g.95992  ORF Transcript_36445/g.95992 Transcript_36445/m.95992 type:complete len:240 (+) Transcript_36445:787-1506(+)